MQAVRKLAFDPKSIKALSLDITGTLLSYKTPVHQAYAEMCRESGFSDPPTDVEWKNGFKKAFKSHSINSPCYGALDGISEREWWSRMVRSALVSCNRVAFDEMEFQRFFKKVYQYYATDESVEVIPDAKRFLDWATDIKECKRAFVLGVTSNTGCRTIETVLPMKGIHNYFSFYVNSKEVKAEKPSPVIFEKSWQEIKHLDPFIKRHEVLHIGDNAERDYAGARSYGFQGLLLDRSDNPDVVRYQPGVVSPNFLGKSPEDLQSHTIKNFDEVRVLLEGGSIPLKLDHTVQYTDN